MTNTKLPIKQGEMLCTTTIRIECYDLNGNSCSGTGFYYNIEKPSGYVPVVITNKHVFNNMRSVKLVFTKSDDFGNRINEHFTFQIDDFLIGVINHPDVDVDLCALTLLHILEDLRSKGIEIHTYFINKSIIPNHHDLQNLDAIEEILMIGYPNGIWDKINNLPLVRRGITSTDPKICYNGKREFLIDAACFPGSSGSPVFYLDRTYKTEIGNNSLGHKIFLLGILYAGPTQEIEGRVENRESRVKIYSNVMMNLGHVISSSRLLELESEIEKKLI